MRSFYFYFNYFFSQLYLKVLSFFSPSVLLQNMSHAVLRPFLFLVSSHSLPFELLLGGVVSPAGVSSLFFVLWAVPRGNAYWINLVKLAFSSLMLIVPCYNSTSCMTGFSGRRARRLVLGLPYASNVFWIFHIYISYIFNFLPMVA